MEKTTSLVIQSQEDRERTLSECVRVIEASQKVLITTHINSDGDAIGSQLGLYHFLRGLGKEVVLLNPSKVPDNLRFLNGSEHIEVFQEQEHATLVEQVDTIFVVDVNSLSRLGDLGEPLRLARATKVIIDHHLDPEDFADLFFVETDLCATGYMLGTIFERFGDEYFTPDVAAGLYTAIMTDTGSFRYPRTTSAVHRMIARLIDAGADPVFIYESVHNQGSLARSRLLGRTLAGLETYHDGRLALMKVTLQMFTETDTARADTEGFVEHTLSLEGVIMGVLVVETDEMIKISLRSKGTVPVNIIAAEFGGGGHLNAAGARSADLPLDQVVWRVVQLSASHLQASGSGQ